MKNLYKILLVILITNLGFAQSSKTIFSEQDISVSYNLFKIGTTINKQTGTVFSEYKLTTTIVNSSSKYWAYGSGCSLKVENISSNLITPSDEKFCKNNGRANVDHFCIENNCNNFPKVNGVAAPHQVICPNSTQKCEKEFLHPDGLAGEPQISWWGWQFTEQIGKMIEKPQVVKQTNSSNKKVELKENKVLSSDENYQLGDNYYDGLNGFPKDYVKARFYYEKVNSNDIKEGAAACCLSSMYKKGNGVAVDLILAEQYAKKKRALGVYSSCR